MIRVLDRNADITTRYGGGFVQSIDGLAGGQSGGRTQRLVLLRQRDRVRRSAPPSTTSPAATGSGGTTATGPRRCGCPAVVGSWPEPFLHGFQGKRWPVIACDVLEPSRCSLRAPRRLRAAGVGRRRAGRRADDDRGLGRPLEQRRARIDRRTCSPTGPTGAASSPASSAPREPLLELLNQRGQPAGSIGKGGGLIAALRPGDGPPTWVVTGTDAKGVAAAAGLLGAGLRDHYAVADPARRRARSGCRSREARARLHAGPQPAAPGLAGRRDRLPGRAGGRRLRLLEPARPGRPPASPTALAGLAAGAGRAVRASLRLALPLLALHGRSSTPWSATAGDTVLVRGWEMPVLGNTDVTLESLAAGAVDRPAGRGGRARLRRLLRLRRPGPRPARAAARRPPLGDDAPGSSRGWSRWPPPTARACGRPRRCAGPGAEPVGRAALARRLVEGSLDRAVDVAATLELRGHSLPACGPRRAPSARATTRRCRDAAPRSSLAALAAADRRRRARSRPIPRIETGRRRASRSPSAWRCSRWRAVPFALTEVAVAWLTPRSRASGLTYRYPGGRPRRAARRRPAGRAGRVRRARGPLGLRQVDAAARRLRPRPALPRRAVEGELEVAGMDVALARPGGARRGGRAGRPGARDAGRQHHGARRDRAAARAPRRPAGGAVARRRGGGAGARRSTACSSAPPTRSPGGELQRVALAAALATRPAPGPARRAHLAARPGRRRRADLAAPPAERGVGRGRAARRAPARALPGGGRPGDRARRGRDRLRRRARESSSTGRWTPTRCSPPRRAAASREAGLPAPASVREARRDARRRRASTPDVPESPARERRRGTFAGGARDRAGASVTLWVELGEGEERTEALRGVDLEIAAGRAGRADGPQRRRQEHAAAGGGRAGRAAARADRRARAASRCCPSGPATSSSTSGSATSSAATRAPRRCGASGSSGLADADPRDLSGGERQRLALAIVLAGRGTGTASCPALVLLDEPTRGMDRARKGELAELDRASSPARGAAVVIATHDVEFAATFAERVVLLGRGEVVADGSAERAALRRLVLLDRGRADPRRRRDHGRGGRRGPARGPAGRASGPRSGRGELAARRAGWCSG